MYNQINHNSMDLLFKPDHWLNNHLISLEAQILILYNEYQQAKEAKTIKRELQDNNLVLVTDVYGGSNIGKPHESVKELSNDVQSQRSIDNAIAQIKTWESDGYEVRHTDE